MLKFPTTYTVIKKKKKKFNDIHTKRDVITFFILVKGSPEGAEEQLLSQLTRYSITATERKTRGGLR